ncbi:MAG: gamma-glutamyl-gamma-aminobutyrate hydrolase family protein [Rhodothermales bacterium]
MPPRPHIGITTSLNDGEQRLDRRYVLAVERAGGLPLIVPMVESEEAANAVAALLDGLVITGGPAIVQGLNGALPDDIEETDPARLASDTHMLNAFLAAQRPVLGICYGMQLANAAAGGTLYADVQAQFDGSAAHSQKRGASDHPVAVEPGTHLHRVLHRDQFTVNTRHIQAIDAPGRGFRVAARAPDGVVEAVESEDGVVLGVQWHPERMGEAMAPLFRHLVDRARDRRSAAQ